MNALETKVLELIGESTTSPDVFLDTAAGMAPIRDSINDAIQEIVMLTGGNKREYFIPLRAGQGFYRFRLNSGYFGWVTDAYRVNQGQRLEQTDLTRLSVHDPRWMVHTGSPWAYLQIGPEIVGFYPRPSGNSDVIQVSLVEIPESYEHERDRIKLRKSFQHAVVSYAVGEYWASRGDAMEAQKHMELYLDILGMKKQYDPQDRSPRFETRKEPYPVVTS